MMYFIPWVVFLALVIVSVPIASWIEKRKLRAAYPEQFESDDPGDEEDDVAEAGEAEVVEADVGEPEVVFEAGGDDFGAGAAEDLSAFDDFK